MKIIYTETFEKSILKIDNKIQILIVKKIESLANNDKNLDIKKLNPKKM